MYRGRNQNRNVDGDRSSRPGGKAAHRHAPVGADGPSSTDNLFGSEDGRQTSKQMSAGGRDDRPSSHIGRLLDQQGQNSPEAAGSSSKQSESCSFSLDSASESALSAGSMDNLVLGGIQIGKTEGDQVVSRDSITFHVDLSLKERMYRGRNRNVGGRSSTWGRSSRPGGEAAHRDAPVRADGPSSNDPFGSKDGISRSGKQTSQQMSQDGIPNHSEHENAYQQDCTSPGGKDRPSHVGRLQQGQNSPEVVGTSSKQSKWSFASDSASEKDWPSLSTLPDSMDSLVARGILDESQQPLKSGSNEINKPSQNKRPQCGQTSSGTTVGNGDSEHSDHSERSAVVDSFDICPIKTGTGTGTGTGTPVMLKASLFAKNKEKRNENRRSMEGQKGSVLRPGMVLLKRYISCSDQVKIVKICRDLGLGSGGFYQPGYRDRGQLRLKMMCLGKNWDPETSEYGDQRPIDGAKPPSIPDEFFQLVKKAIQDSHSVFKESNVKSTPPMSPDICIVNFYTESGRLGLHQDRDESQESLNNGLPVVSFSIGDSANFLYGDQRDVDEAEKVVLESGDVLIFGGKSRHIFHGVTAILPKTAPNAVLEESNLRPGRLNLTFRQY